MPVEVGIPVGTTMEKAYAGDVEGRFAYAHSATTLGSDRRDELFVIVPGSGVGDLAGIFGSGGMAIDPDDTHRVWFDYELG